MFSSLVALFRMDSSPILAIANKLAKMPSFEHFRFTDLDPFEAKHLEQALKDLAGEAGLGESSFDFGQPSTKCVFFESRRITATNTTEKYFYIDLSTRQKIIQAFDDNLLSNDVPMPHVSKFLPLNEYSLVDPWYAIEYETTFNPFDGETAREAVEKQMELLLKASDSESEMKNLIEVFDEEEILDDENQKGEMTEDGRWVRVPYSIDRDDIRDFIIRLQRISLYIYNALKLCIEKDWTSERLTFKKCCAEAIKKLNDVGLVMWTDKAGAPVLWWFQEFRKGRKFPNYLIENSRYGPPILVNNPRSAKRMRLFGDNNLADLTVEKMRDHFLSEEMDLLVEEMNNDKEAGDPIVTKERVKERYHLKTITKSTIHNWMLFLGFRQSEYKKGCYTATHNKPKNIAANIQVRFSDCSTV
jgi:hypothetical protein